MKQLLPQSIGEAGAQSLPLDVDLRLDQTTQQNETDQEPEAARDGKTWDQGCRSGCRGTRSKQEADR